MFTKIQKYSAGNLAPTGSVCIRRFSFASVVCAWFLVVSEDWKKIGLSKASMLKKGSAFALTFFCAFTFYSILCGFCVVPSNVVSLMCLQLVVLQGQAPDQAVGLHPVCIVSFVLEPIFKMALWSLVL